MSAKMLVNVDALTCRYGQGAPIRLPNMAIATGQHTLLLGPSGSGKSTLMNAIAGIQTVAEGSVAIDGVAMSSLPAHARDKLRGEKMGLVMQRLHLISALTVRANLRLAQTLAGQSPDDARITQVANELNIADKLNRYPRQLSQGEAQRVAIARAVINQPALVLADEPTSALDDANAEAAIQLLLAQAAKHNATLIVATHDARIKAHFQHIVTLGA
jgi:putative ABC transport system ATP-binding protein